MIEEKKDKMKVGGLEVEEVLEEEEDLEEEVLEEEEDLEEEVLEGVIQVLEVIEVLEVVIEMLGVIDVVVLGEGIYREV